MDTNKVDLCLTTDGEVVLSSALQWRFKFGEEFCINLTERPPLWVRIGLFVWFGVRGEKIDRD